MPSVQWYKKVSIIFLMPHVYHKHRKIHKKEKKTALDHFMLLIAFVGPLMTLPQAGEIWINRHVAGVSVVSWTAYVILTVIWLAYSFYHKEKPLIVGNLLYLVVNCVVLLGILTIHA